MGDKRTNPRVYQEGYTLIELLVVIAILALLAASVVSLSPRSRDGTDPGSIAQNLAADLNRTRTRALAGGVPASIEFRDAGWTNAESGHGTLPADVTLLFGAERAPAASPGFQSVTFYPDGSSSGLMVTIRGAGTEEQVEVDWLTSRITVSR